MPNSTDYRLSPMLREYVVALMENEGRITDQSICEQCLEPILNNRYEIHHTKYKDATYYDLEVVCLSCNRLGKNTGLS